MKNTAKSILALILALSMIISLAACAALDSLSAPLTEKVEEMLACSIAGDEDGAYALLYPGVAERSAYHDLFLQICDYFPITEDYSLSVMNVTTSKGIGNGAASTMQGQYQVEFDGLVYYLFVVHVSNSGGSGFQTFRIVSKAEYDGLQVGSRS